MPPEQPVPEADGEDYYEKLGVAKIINAAGTYTLLSSSIMPRSVQAAVARAARHPVRLLDLQKAAGEYLARALKCEAAMVTSGASSAITLGAAACLTVANLDAIKSAQAATSESVVRELLQSAQAATSESVVRELLKKIPADMAGMKNQVIVQRAHRYDYDHSLTNCGVQFVEVQTVEEYRAAFSDRIVMAFFYNAALGGEISREDWVHIAHQHGIPCLNDAAADVPPISNLWNYTAMGFDLVAFSGGKGIRGPQNTGLLLGRRDLIQAASQNNSPFDDTIGRGMKVAKEQIVGLVASLDWLLSQSDDEMQAEFLKTAHSISDALRDLPGMEASIARGPVANHVPHLLLRYDQSRIRISPAAVAEELRRGDPSIELNPATGGKDPASGLPADENTIVVGVWMLQPGEEVIVARRLRSVLEAKVVR